MSNDPFSVHPLYNAWIKAQSQMFEAQAPLWKHMAETMSGTRTSELSALPEQLWSDAQRQGQEWVAHFAERVGFPSDDEGIAQETLKRMMDPGQFLFAGSDEINQTIQKLVEGPEFTDLATLENQRLKATREWIALREASTEYRAVTAKAWGRAFEQFSKDMADDPEIWTSGMRPIINRWLDIANKELISTQRTDAFLEAQRKLLRAGVDYRLREREMVEVWCETHSMPTRTEIDDLHSMVHQLRRDVRTLKKQLQAQQAAAPKKRPVKRKEVEG